MKTIFNAPSKAALLVVATLGLAACGGSSGPTVFDSANPPRPAPVVEPVVINLVAGEEFAIQAGDELRPDGEAELEFRVVAASGERFVTLVSGTAEVERMPE